MEAIPKTHEDIEAQIREIQSKRKEVIVEGDKGVGLGESGYFDSEIYDSGGTKSKYEGYVTSIAANDEVDDEEEDVGFNQKRTSGLGATVAFFNDIARTDKDFDPLADRRRPTIADREDEYRQKRRRMIISPERIDPFADGGKTPDFNARGYTQIMKEQILKGEENEIRKKLVEKSKDGSLKISNGEAKSAPKKRGRWDQTVEESPVPSKKKTLSVSTSSGAATPIWDNDRTPADHRWDDTPGHKGSETPGATPGQSTRVWDSTPSHATPGAVTPGRDTPGHDKSTTRRNRWDETPKTERETPGHSSGWAETPRTDRTGVDHIQETPTPGASKRRSRWDETPSAQLTPSSGMTPGGMTPQTPHGTPSHATPMLTPGGSTPVGVKAMAMATPTPGHLATMTPEQLQAYRWEREIDERNRPYSDDELDAMFPMGYKILPPPAGYIPIRTPARKLTATPTPVMGNTPQGFFIQQEDKTAKYLDNQPKGQNLPFMKPEDAQYFDKLLVDVDEEALSPEEQKERKIMKLLLKIKNGTPPMRKAALRQITDKAREFGAGPLFNQILPLLMSPTLEDQERHLLVKVIDRILYKLDDLVRPYVHKILVVIEPLLIDEDYYARVEGREIISNLAKAAGLATMISTMRPDIDNIDEYVRNTTARAFAVVASALGIPSLLPFLKAVCRSKKSWQARHTGIKIVQQIAILMGCAILPHLKSLVEIIEHGLVDEQQKLNKAGQQLKILPHHVLNEKEEPIELCSSVECKGIIGNDGRHYILDLLRTFPPDVNFLKLDEDLSKDVTLLGFPIEHKHKLCCLRQELIDGFVDSRYMMFIKYAAYHLQELNFVKNQEIINNNKDKLKIEESKEQTTKSNRLEPEEAKKIVESFTDSNKLEESTKNIVKTAAMAVGSLKETEFDIRFNPDVYSPGIQHSETLDPPIVKQRQLVKDAADFLLTVQIPTFIRDCLDHSSAPMDGFTLSEAMHNRGINIRYLGKVCNLLYRVKQLEYLHSIAVGEIVLRALKHIFTIYLQGTELMNLSVAVAHFLNCFLYSGVISNPLGVDESKNNRKRNRRRGRNNPLVCIDTNEWANVTSKTLWAQLKSELKSYFDYDLSTSDIETTIEMYGLQKVSLLRSFCIKTGLQILLRDYNFEMKNKVIFLEEDILNIFPVVKHINPRATDAYNFYTTGQNKIQQGYLKDGYELISEALSLLNNVYGAMHPEIAQCLRMIARLNYIMGEHTEAMAYQQKAVLMSERVNGVDHPYTITEYAHLALYCFANSQVSTALKLLYRARYLALLVCGENHPEVALLDSNISLILHAVGEYELSLRFLEKALALNIKYYGLKSLKVAVSYHLVARTQSCMGNFRAALNNEKEAYAIYKQQLGDNHEKTKESSECLRHLTQQAVVLQKKMNEIYTGKNGAPLPPIQIQPPSMGSVLDMLNVINGILYVQISQEDIENFKVEIEKQNLKDKKSEEENESKIENLNQ